MWNKIKPWLLAALATVVVGYATPGWAQFGSPPGFFGGGTDNQNGHLQQPPQEETFPEVDPYYPPEKPHDVVPHEHKNQPDQHEGASEPNWPSKPLFTDPSACDEHMDCWVFIHELNAGKLLLAIIIGSFILVFGLGLLFRG